MRNFRNCAFAVSAPQFTEDRTDTIIRDMRVSQMPNADAATHGHLVGCSVTIANATKLSKIDREIAAINDKLDALLSLLKK